jgi:hypothetical protein
MPAVKFKIVGSQAGADVNLGANGQYQFVKGICEIDCTLEDAKKHQHILGKFYSAKRVRSKADPAPTPDIDEVDEDDGMDVVKTTKAAK